MSHEKKKIINFLHVIHKMYHISHNFTLQCYLRRHPHSPHISSDPGSLLSFRNKPVGVGIEADLGAGQSGDRIPVGTKFSNPASCNNGYQVSFPGVKWPGRVIDHPPPSSAEVKERVELYLHSPFAPL
jgi:hypothetical protein